MFFSRILKLIDQDKSVLYPALISSFLIFWLPEIFPIAASQNNAAIILLVSAGLQLFVQLFTAECARQIIIRPVVLFSQALSVSVRRYVPALFFSGLLGVLLLSIGILSDRLGTAGLLLLPLVFLLGLALQLFPLIYVLSGMPVYKIYGVLALFFRRYPRRALQLLSFFLLVSVLLNMATYWLARLPGNFKTLLVPLFGGVGLVFLFYGLTLLLLDNNRISELV